MSFEPIHAEQFLDKVAIETFKGNVAIAGYRFPVDRRLGVERRGKSVSVWMPKCPPEHLGLKEIIPKPFLATRKSGDPTGRISKTLDGFLDFIDSRAEIYKVKLGSLAELKSLVGWYVGEGTVSDSLSDPEAPLDEFEEEPTKLKIVNEILYGPPGTGKTWATTERAVALADPAFVGGRDELKKRYDQLVEDGRIVFTTFHQSFSYEDFVEGIRPEINDEDDNALGYIVEDGVFKQLCDLAGGTVQGVSGAPSSIEGRGIWKMSVGRANGDDYFEECIESDVLLLGWGGNIDISGTDDQDSIRIVLKEAEYARADSAAQSLQWFKNEMQIGDLVVVSEGNLKFRGIAEVTGEYEFREVDGRDSYFQSRAVKWLRVFEPGRPAKELFKKGITQRSLYRLRDRSIYFERLKRLLDEDTSVVYPRVLIIDEINRGNVSRIFGELITLLEPDKRAGQPDSRSVTLPYSKQVFSVPPNLHVIGTMNTADKSLAQLDLALRRRFDFVELMPDASLLDVVMVHGVSVGRLLRVLNERIEILLDRDHQIGHAYFMALRDLTTDEEKERTLAAIFRNKVIPLLQEYFYSDWERIGWVLNDPDKSSAHQFISFNDGEAPPAGLFSSKVEVTQLQDRRYRVNESAFTLADSYSQIISSK